MADKKKTIIIFYSKGFNDQTALALKEYYDSIPKDVNAILIDNKDISFYGIDGIANFSRRFTSRNMPWLRRTFSAISYAINKISDTKKSNQTEAPQEVKEQKEEFFVNLKTKHRQVDNIIKRFDADVVVCTTAKSLKKCVKTKERLGLDFVICSSMTDYFTNRGLINKAVDKYLVQNDLIKQTLTTLGVNEDSTAVLGTPILNSTKKQYDKNEVLEEFGIQSKNLPIAVLVGGRYGAGTLKTAFKDLAVYSEKMNLVVLTNNSTSLKSFIESYCKSAAIKENVYCVDDPGDIAKIYSIADVMITSPTANITYEASSRGIPCVLIKPLNNMEDGNFGYLTAEGLALRGEVTTHIVPSVLSVINKDSYYEEIINSIKGKFSQDCAKAYGDFVLSLVHEKRQRPRKVSIKNEDDKKKKKK